MDKSIQFLAEGIERFPNAESLRVCLAVSYMNAGSYQKALSYLLKLSHLKEAIYYIANCYQALNDAEKAEAYLKKYQSL